MGAKIWYFIHQVSQAPVGGAQRRWISLRGRLVVDRGGGMNGGCEECVSEREGNGVTEVKRMKQGKVGVRTE